MKRLSRGYILDICMEQTYYRLFLIRQLKIFSVDVSAGLGSTSDLCMLQL